jgi:transposase
MNNDIIKSLELPYFFVVQDYNTITVGATRVKLYDLHTIRRDEYVCDKCGCVDRHIPKEFKTSKIKYDIASNRLVALRVKKRRFTCSHCGKTFTEDIKIVEPGCFISRRLKRIISQNLMKGISNKANAFATFVSQSSVARFLYNNWPEIVQNFKYLPEVIGLDDFKGTKDCKDKMACIIVDQNK